MGIFGAEEKRSTFDIFKFMRFPPFPPFHELLHCIKDKGWTFGWQNEDRGSIQGDSKGLGGYLFYRNTLNMEVGRFGGRR